MNTPNARERILETAARIFADKSFEGSRIDEIAREANVPKSLIYYHFKSKDDILRVLTDNFKKEYLDIIDKNKNEKSQDKTNKRQDYMKTIFYDFGIRNENLIRVMLIDSLKKTTDSSVLFDIIKALIEKESEESAEMKKVTEVSDNIKKGYEISKEAKEEIKETEERYGAKCKPEDSFVSNKEVENRDKTEESTWSDEAEELLQKDRIAEFFTNFMPNYAYICFADAWVKYFNMDRAQFDKLYLEVYEETHGAYHRNKEKDCI